MGRGEREEWPFREDACSSWDGGFCEHAETLGTSEADFPEFGGDDGRSTHRIDAEGCRVSCEVFPFLITRARPRLDVVRLGRLPSNVSEMRMRKNMIQLVVMCC